MSRRRKRNSQRPAAGPVRSRPFAEAMTEDEVRRRVIAMATAPRDLATAARSLLDGVPDDVVARVVDVLAGELLDRLWPIGWQPSEVVWQARRRSAGAERAAVAGIAHAAAGWPGPDLHPGWRDQLAALDIDLDVDPSEGHSSGPAPAPLVAAHGLAAALDLLGALVHLPPVEVLMPVPGRPDIAVAAAAAGATAGGIDAKVLERVRALLAKAESTSFEAEAQAFTAKAHELMTRHSLEHALVTTGPADRDRPTARRFCIDDPYADAKSHLLAVIADACRCSAVLLSGLQMVTVVGFADDQAEVDVLFTSLLVQAQTALDQLARSSAPGSRERSRGFRSSFLRGFAQRIGDRLHQAGAATVAEVDRSSGGALVPVLAERREAVDEQVAVMHPRLRTKHVAAPTDRLGWAAGRQAADRADLPWQRLDAG